MLTLNQPPLTQHISVPKDMSQLSVEAFTAGIVEGVLDALDVVSDSLAVRDRLTPSRPGSRHIQWGRINTLNGQSF